MSKMYQSDDVEHVNFKGFGQRSLLEVVLKQIVRADSDVDCNFY